VLVEAIIVEISNDVARELGVQFLFGGKDKPFAVTNFGNSSPNIIDVAGGLLANKLDQTTTVVNGSTVTTTTNSTAGDLLKQNAASKILAASGGYSGFLTQLGNNTYLGALINAVATDKNSNILSTPHITTNNNVPASILFGKEIPVATGEALSSANFNNTFRTISRQNVGIELDVTPQINAGDQVRLDLRQEVSSIAGTVSSRSDDIIVNKREIKTTVTVGDREIVALGGLLDDNEQRTLQKVPLLGDVPVLGELFKSRGRSHVKTNLMVFIRPTIMRNANDRRADRAALWRGAQRARAFEPGREPGIDDLVEDYLGATPGRAGKVVAVAPGDTVIAPRRRANAVDGCCRPTRPAPEPWTSRPSSPARTRRRRCLMASRATRAIWWSARMRTASPAMREGADPFVLLDLRRALGRPVSLRKVAPPDYESCWPNAMPWTARRRWRATWALVARARSAGARPAHGGRPARQRGRRARDPADQRPDRRRAAPGRVRHPRRTLRTGAGRADARGRRAGGKAADAAACRAGAGQPHQGHGAARHRRTPRAAGRAHQPEPGRQAGRRARVHAAQPRGRTRGAAPARQGERRAGSGHLGSTSGRKKCCAARWPNPTASCWSPAPPDRARPPRSMPRCASSTMARATS
jgi:hypothetical protein